MGLAAGVAGPEGDDPSDGQEGAAAEQGRLLEMPIVWLRGQFRAMGQPDADGPAIALMASYQGIARLTNSFRGPKVMTTGCRRLERWIDFLD